MDLIFAIFLIGLFTPFLVYVSRHKTPDKIMAALSQWFHSEVWDRDEPVSVPVKDKKTIHREQHKGWSDEFKAQAGHAWNRRKLEIDEAPVVLQVEDDEDYWTIRTYDGHIVRTNRCKHKRNEECHRCSR